MLAPARSQYPFSRFGACALALTASHALAQAPDTTKPTAGAQAQAPAEKPAKPADAKPWRLQDELTWVKLSFEQRSRYESLHNQFRYRRQSGQNVHLPDNDEDILALRTSMLLETGNRWISGGLEVLDARHYGAGPDSNLDATMSNAADVLQAYLDLSLGELGSGVHRLRAGRQTIDLGNRRLVARNAFRNTINSFLAVDWLWTTEQSTLRAFWSMPTQRRPEDFTSLRDNEQDWDRQSLDLQFWGIYEDWRLTDRTNLEFYVFGLDERGTNTRRRNLYTPGFRVNRAAKPASFHYEVEGTIQFGESKAAATSTTPADVVLRHHLAGFAMGALGYTFDMPWTPSVTASYSYASGDQDPNDNTNNRYDTLFGARRFEYGPTGIWGAVARANLQSPELHLTLKPVKGVELMTAYRGIFLASERDAWTAANLRDRSGRSGHHVGDQLEGRIRWDVMPKNLRLEVGGAVLFTGSFQENASNDRGRDSTYGYVEMTWWF